MGEAAALDQVQLQQRGSWQEAPADSLHHGRVTQAVSPCSAVCSCVGVHQRA